MSPFSVFVRPAWHSPQSNYSVLIVPPAEEPITLDEAKLRAGFTWVSPDPRDALMTGFIAAARSKVELDTGLALLTQTRDVTLLPNASGIVPLPMQATPLQSITEVTAFTASGNRLVLDPLTAVSVGPYGQVRVTTWEAGWTAVTVRIVAGWPDVPALKAEAPLLVHAVGLLTAHYATLGRDLASTTPATETPMGYDEAIEPHRLMWVT